MLAATGGNKSAAAQIPGIERKTLYRKLERMRLWGRRPDAVIVHWSLGPMDSQVAGLEPLVVFR